MNQISQNSKVRSWSIFPFFLQFWQFDLHCLLCLMLYYLGLRKLTHWPLWCPPSYWDEVVDYWLLTVILPSNHQFCDFYHFGFGFTLELFHSWLSCLLLLPSFLCFWVSKNWSLDFHWKITIVFFFFSFKPWCFIITSR